MAGIFPPSRAVPGNLSPFAAATLPGLPASARLLITILDRKSKGHPECWCKNSTLAGLLKCCERTIRNALRALEGAGLIRVVRDYTLSSRRKIVLLWKRPCDVSVPANVAVQVAANMCPEIGPPPDPPIVEPDGNTLGESGGEPAPPPGFDQVPPEREEAPIPEATPEQAAKLVEAAAKVFPDQAPRLVAELAKKWAPDWIRAAFKRAVQKRDAGGDVVPGYLIGCLKGFAADGGPPPELTAPELSREEIERKFWEAFNRT